MSSQLPAERPVGSAELIHAFPDQMPTGVTVADDGRIFVCYPRCGDTVDFTVAELLHGQPAPPPARSPGRRGHARAAVRRHAHAGRRRARAAQPLKTSEPSPPTWHGGSSLPAAQPPATSATLGARSWLQKTLAADCGAMPIV